MGLIQANNLSKHYGRGAARVTALAAADLAVEAGDFVAIMGESGAGKSTLLSILGAMNAPSTGRYVVDGIDVYALDGDRQADFRREYLGFVFQSFHLLAYLTVVENVMLPLATTRLPTRRRREMALAALESVGLADKADRLPSAISGGEKERVAVARAIVNRPVILLADEPTGNLDSRNSDEIMALLGRLNAAGTTVLMVTHSRRCAAHARRVLTVLDGRLGEND